MRKTVSVLLVTSSLLFGSQIFFMDLSESLFFTETVVVAEVSEAIDFPMDYLSRTEFIFQIHDVILGSDSLKGSFIAQYSMNYPVSYIDEEGNEIWESPLVSGSGIERSVEKGDTVVVFIGYIPNDPEQHSEIVRIEPMENLDLVLQHLAEIED